MKPLLKRSALAHSKTDLCPQFPKSPAFVGATHCLDNDFCHWDSKVFYLYVQKCCLDIQLAFC